MHSLFDYDLIGFQTDEWLDAFNEYIVAECRGQVHRDGRVTAFGNRVQEAGAGVVALGSLYADPVGAMRRARRVESTA